jgi:excisionase family DNA binding protein
MTDTPRLALSREEAAAALSVSLTTFEERIQGELRLVRLGRRKLVPVTEIRRWLDENAEAPMNEQVAA